MQSHQPLQHSKETLLQICMQPWVACYPGCQMFRAPLVWNETFVFSDWSFMINKAICKQLDMLTKTSNKDKWTRKPGRLVRAAGCKDSASLDCMHSSSRISLQQNHVFCDTITAESTELKINCFSENLWPGLVQLLNNCPALISKHTSLWLRHCAWPH